MSSNGMVKDEIDILYAASNQLTQASTPLEQLESVSDYARENGAYSGTLFYIDNDADGEPKWAEIVANWALIGESIVTQLSVGERYYVPDLLLSQMLQLYVDIPYLIEDMGSQPQLDVTTRQNFERLGTRSTAILPLNNKGRWVGLFMFSWHEPRRFTERDQRIYTAIVQQASAAIDSVRLFEQTQKRAAELETAKNEIEFLYAASNMLARASTSAELLEAVSAYPRAKGAVSGQLFHFTHDRLDQMDTVASWGVRSEFKLGEGYTLELGQREFPKYWLSKPQSPTLIADVMSDELVDPMSREIFANLRVHALALLPLYTNSRWIGVFSFYWRVPYIFNERDQRIFTTLQRQLAPVIDSMWLFEQTQKRAAELEIAKTEIELLHTASNQLAQAETPDELLEAISVYAREMGASSGELLYMINDAENTNLICETMAEWLLDGGIPQGIGRRYSGFGSDAGSTSWMAQPDMPMLVTNAPDDTRFLSDLRRHWRERQISSFAILPLTNRGRWVGLITFGWTLPYSFSERDQRIYTALIQQAAPAIDSIRLLEQNRERAVRAEHLLSINTALSQATDEIQILSAVAEYAVQQGAQRLFLDYVYVDEQGNRVNSRIAAMWENDTGVLYDPAKHEVYNLEDYGFPTFWDDQLEEVIFIENFSTSPLFTEEMRNHLLPRVKGRAVAAVPLYSSGRFQGTISIVWFEPHNFSNEERHIYTELMQTVPSIVASRRAYLAEQARAHELETVAKVSAAATRILDVSVLLKTTVELTQLNFADYHLAVYLLDTSGRYLEKAASASAYVEIPHGFTFALQDEQSMIAQAGQLRQSIIVNDTGSAKQYTQVAFCKDTCSEMAIPMIVADKLIGVLDVQSPILNRFSETDARVMSMLADLIAVAVQNARLYEQAQELAALEERNRLARELHDSVSQAMYGIALGARTAHALLQHDPARLNEPLDYVLSLAEAGLTEMRALIFDLRPESLENEGLITALHKQAEVLQGRHGIRVIVDFCEEPELSLEIKEMLYRIAREALHNTVKHAQATQVSLRLNESDDGLALEITDNGHGFDTNGAFPGHLGLQSMRERAARLNADLEITSAPEKGTRISIRIPRLFN